MMQLVFLSVLALASADPRLAEQGSCLVDSAEAVSDLMDGSMFIWASVARCGHAGEMVKCEINIASAIQSVNSMINVILRALDKCGDIHTANAECGIAASVLTKSTAGLTASSGGIIQKCFQHPAHGNNFVHQEPAMCVVNIKNTAKSLFKTIKAFMTVKNNCKEQDSRACASNALSIVAAFAGMGEYLAGALGQCSPNGFVGARCAQEGEMLVHHLMKVSQAGVDLSAACGEKPAPVVIPGVTQGPTKAPDLGILDTGRLYSEDAAKTKTVMGASPNFLLAAFLPVTAIVSFVGGRSYANRRSGAEQVRELE